MDLHTFGNIVNIINNKKDKNQNQKYYDKYFSNINIGMSVEDLKINSIKI